MPELPEVETIRRSLEPIVVNHTLIGVEIRENRLRIPVNTVQFGHLLGRTIITLQRRAKYLVWHFDNQASLVIHLGMSGRLGINKSGQLADKHIHIIFFLDNGVELFYRDPRRFGLVQAIAPDELDGYSRFRHLGPEPFDTEFDLDYLQQKLKSSKKPIKNWLMDATMVVGIGNIYANEILFKSGIHPLRLGKTIRKREQERLFSGIRSILSAAMEKGGTTLNDFSNANGEPGFFQYDVSVYQREGQACPTCGSKIKKIVLGGRSTFYCPRCQG